MPWLTDADFLRHNKRAEGRLGEIWRQVANKTLERTGDEGRAICEANAVIAPIGENLSDPFCEDKWLGRLDGQIHRNRSKCGRPVSASSGYHRSPTLLMRCGAAFMRNSSIRTPPSISFHRTGVERFVPRPLLFTKFANS